MNLAKDRLPLQHAPTESYTFKRGELKQAEDLRLVKHFANWLTRISENKQVSEENFEMDLMDGVALCTVLQKLEGSGVTKFHAQPKSAFQAKENLLCFQAGTRALALPITFGSEDLEKQNISRIISTLIFVAHTAHAQGVFVKEMDKEIVDKVEEMEDELQAVAEEEEEKAAAQAAETDAAVPWWHHVLIKLGLGEWIASLNQEAVKAYLATLKTNVEAKLPEAIKAKLQQQQQDSSNEATTTTE